MKIIGIDLAGPANHKDTVMAVFDANKGQLLFENFMDHASDEKIISTITKVSSHSKVVIGMDAPLSYQDGGGDRPQDKSIRQFIKGYGLSGSSIMPPTLTKMAYLTLRGITLSRRLMVLNLFEKVQLVEVHPGAAIGTRIGQERIHHALQYKKDIVSREFILEWFHTIGMAGLPKETVQSTHHMDACAAALAAWHWADPLKKPTWHWKDTTPEHPFELCC